MVARARVVRASQVSGRRPLPLAVAAWGIWPLEIEAEQNRFSNAVGHNKANVSATWDETERFHKFILTVFKI